LRVTPAASSNSCKGYSLTYGARFLKRTIGIVSLPVSQRWSEGKAFTADVKDGRIEVSVSSASLAATA
jgi:hypothetical protein